MMPTINIKVDFESSFKKKINPQAIKKAQTVTIKNTTLEAEKMCKSHETPGPGNQLPGTTYKAVGKLRGGHTPHITQNEGQVRNESAQYWRYVAFGTRKMPARNYPQKVVNQLGSKKYITRTFLTELRRMGVIE